jgi:hypothetical protein
MFYFVVSILMDSERFTNYLQIRANSAEGIVQMEVNSVSGIPIPSESIVMSERLNSEILSAPPITNQLLLDSNLNFSYDGSSSQDRVRLSSEPAIFRILATFSMARPSVSGF